jgi:hypothetical protein
MEVLKYYKKIDDFIKDTKDNTIEYFLFVAEKTDFSIEKLQNTDIKFCGAIFPQIILNEKTYESGILSVELDKQTETFLIKDIENLELTKDDFQQDVDSISIIVDGLSTKTTPFLESIFNSLPLNTEIIGGGAGKLTLEQEPVIFTNEGIFQDSAIVLALKSNLYVGVENGWEYLDGPFIATSANRNIVHSLNFENAFELYKKVVEKDSGIKFTEDNFFELAKSYPLRIIKFNKEVVVRDPIAKNEKGDIVLVGDLEQNSTINILKGNQETLISSSGTAALKAIDKKKSSCNSTCTSNSVVLFDCITRAIFLEERFKEELSEIKKHIPTQQLFGALTLGEIANNGNEYINFYNKTCVLGVLC